MTDPSEAVHSDDVCSRTTRRGNRCRNFRVRWWACTGDDPASCEGHLTDDERDRFRAGRQALFGGRDDLEPACWSWPPPTEADIDAAKRAFPGLTLSEGDWRSLMMSEWHQGRCAICGIAGQHLVEDHDHVTGLERGHLCRSCNVKEGMNRGGVFARYRQKNPASICGVREVYYDPFTKEFAEPAPQVDRWKDNPMRGIGL